MKYTNKYKLADSIVNAIINSNKDYDGPPPGPDVISCTSLIGPVRVHVLKSRHQDELVEDVSDCLWRLMGTAIHYVLEKSDNEDVKTEERITEIIDGITVSGKYDRLVGSSLQDYKVTSVWSVILNPEGKIEHERQLNVLRFLMRNKYFVDKLTINFLLRDFQASQVGKRKGYPETPFYSMDLKLWSIAEARAYVEERVAEFKKAFALPDDELPACTNEETWSGRRCEKYCPVNKFCNIYKGGDNGEKPE